MTTDTAMRLSAYFGTTPEFWMNLQTNYDLRILMRERGTIYEHLPHASRAA